MVGYTGGWGYTQPDHHISSFSSVLILHSSVCREHSSSPRGALFFRSFAQRGDLRGSLYNYTTHSRHWRRVIPIATCNTSLDLRKGLARLPQVASDQGLVSVASLCLRDAVLNAHSAHSTTVPRSKCCRIPASTGGRRPGSQPRARDQI